VILRRNTNSVTDMPADIKNEIKQDKVEAVKWYRSAAEQGDVLGQHDLAYVLSVGEGVEAKCGRIIPVVFQKASERGDLDSLCRLGPRTAAAKAHKKTG